jgi:hypothetical protein
MVVQSRPKRSDSIAMNAYLFTAATTVSQVRSAPGAFGESTNSIHTWDSCATLIVCGDQADQAQKQFETWLCRTPEGQNPIQAAIKKIVAAQFVDQLFTELGPEPIDWANISPRIEPTLETTETGNFEQGYWADVNQIVGTEKIPPDLESLRRDLPEDIQSGLNWSADKQYFFIISVFSPPPPPPPDPADESDADATAAGEPGDENPGEYDRDGLAELEAVYRQLMDKEAAALIQARNSVVAAWLWRRFAADTPLAANDIRVDPWCGVIVPDGADGK